MDVSSTLPSSFLFPDEFKQKLHDPTLSLQDWKAQEANKKLNITVRRLPETKRGYMPIRAERFYAVCYVDNIGVSHEARRTAKDFAQLEKLLVEKFPGACVPPFPKSKPALYETFIRAVAKNPYFRVDTSFTAFLDSTLKKYNKRKDNGKPGGSEGSLRWLQALNQYPNQGPQLKNLSYLSQVKAEVERLKDNLTLLARSAEAYEQRLRDTANANKDIEQALRHLLASERNYEIIQGSPENELPDILQTTINYSEKQSRLTDRIYGAAMYDRLILNPVSYEVLLADTFKKYVELLMRKKAALEKTQEKLEAERAGQRKSSKLANLEETEKEMFIEFYSISQGVVGIELENFRRERTEKIRMLYENLSNFHIRGATELLQIWEATGVKVEELDEDWLDDSRRLSQLSGFSKSTWGGMDSRHTVTGDKTVSLKVTEDFEPRKPKYLALTKDETLAAQRVGDLWLATNKNGKTGYVSSEFVVIQADSSSKQAQVTRAREPSTSRPPGLMPPPGLVEMNVKVKSTNIEETEGDDKLSTVSANPVRRSKKVSIFTPETSKKAPSPPLQSTPAGKSLSQLPGVVEKEETKALRSEPNHVVPMGRRRRPSALAPSGPPSPPVTRPSGPPPIGGPGGMMNILAGIKGDPMAKLRKVPEAEKSTPEVSVGKILDKKSDVESTPRRNGSTTQPKPSTNNTGGLMGELLNSPLYGVQQQKNSGKDD